MDYQTFQPCRDLNDIVKCYWTLNVPKEPNPQKQRIVPDGCFEMIFTLGDDIKRYVSEENFIIQPRAMILGQITEPFYIEPVGSVNTFAIRFFPWGFTPFSLLSVKNLENTETKLDVLFGKSASRDLENKISNTTTTLERIKYIEDFLLNKLKKHQTIDNVIKSAIDVLLATKGNISIGKLSQNNSNTKRQLERRFSKIIGLSPKQLAKVIRLQTSLKLLLEGSAENLTSLAYDTNYYDQSHFIKDFKEFTGVTPKRFYKDDNLILSSVFYSEN